MIENLKKILSREGGREYIQPSKEEKADFLLRVRERTGHTLDVGRLSLREGTWHFEYTEDFRRQTKIRPIVNFPILDKHYESDTLWPFFVIRIPGLKQPAVQREIEKKELDERNEAQLLKHFGKTSIANPFILIPQD